jgi:hypothetical protein
LPLRHPEEFSDGILPLVKVRGDDKSLSNSAAQRLKGHPRKLYLCGDRCGLLAEVASVLMSVWSVKAGLSSSWSRVRPMARR